MCECSTRNKFGDSGGIRQTGKKKELNLKFIRWCFNNKLIKTIQWLCENIKTYYVTREDCE